MRFADLRQKNLSRVSRWHTRGGLAEWSLSDWFTATMGELGEAANVAKKINRVRDGLTGNGELTDEQLHQQLSNELADTLIYLDLLAASAGINLEEAVRSKFNATSIKNHFPERL